MEYAIGIGLGAMVYIPSLIKSGSGIQKFIGGARTHARTHHTHTHTHRAKEIS
jgi:hypothetical protein